MLKRFLGCLTAFMVTINTVSIVPAVKAVTVDTLQNGLVLNYAFNDIVNNKVVDISGNSNDGTVVGNATINVQGKVGSSLNLDGTSYVKLPNSLLDNLSDITVSTWVNYASNSFEWARVFDFGQDANNFFFLSKNKHVGLNVNSTPQDLAPTGVQVNDQWVYVTVTLSNNTMIYYENGVEVARKTDATNKPSSIVGSTENYIGKSKFNDPFLIGQMDEFRIYNRALSDTEVSSLSTLVQEQSTVEVYGAGNDNNINTIGGTLQMTAVVRPTNEAVNWSVVNLDGTSTDLATIDSNGLLTGAKVGSVMVIATAQSNPTITGSAKIVITQKVDSLSLSGAEGKTSINAKAGKLQMISSALPNNATDTSVAWSVADINGNITNVASIDSNGILTARKDGSVVVTATAKDGSGATANMTVSITGQVYVSNEKLAIIAPQAPNEPLLYDVPNINNEAAWGTSNTHDPSVFKDGEWYYVFSTDYKVGGPTGVGLHIRKSKDLINWQWVGRVFNEIPAAAIAWSPNAENMWAPDVVKIGDTYYLYYTVSTFGTNTSFIGLATSTSIEGPWIDQGEVYKTKLGVDTDNALDPNIVTDANGDLWLSYGSFFSGLFVSKLDKTTGKLVTPGKGTQISASGTRKNMEAPYIVYNPQFKKYYLFMSYDDLAVDYNVRIAWSDSIEGPYTDLNGNSMMNTPTDRNALYDIGTKLIGSYAFGTDPGWIAPGHNSVLNDNGNFYLVHHARGGADKNWAYLQVRKIVWSSDGKPMVSPERYAGEVEQKIDQSLIAGKWQTIVQDRLNNNKIGSTDITLYPSGKINDENGQSYWELTGDNTLTLNYYAPGVAPGDYWIDTVKVLPAWDYENWAPTVVFTGYNQGNTAVWGKQVESIVAKVTKITVSTIDNVLNITQKGGSLQLLATVNPTYATDASVTWSVVGLDGNATDLATISDTGVLMAAKDGTVKVVAIANDGSNVSGFAEVAITGQASATGGDNTGGTDDGTTGGDNQGDIEKIIIKPVVDNVLPVIVNVIENKDSDTIITLAKEAIDAVTEVTIYDINSIKDGTGNLVINLENDMSIKLPYDIIDKSLLKDNSKVVFRTSVKANSDLYKNLKGINKVLSFEMLVVNGTEETVIHQFASGLAEISVNLTDEELSGLDKSKLVVLYYNKTTNSYEEMETVIDGNKITFKTPHFSEFIIAEKAQATDTSNTNTVILPQTGSFFDSSLLLVGGILIILSGVGVILISRRKDA